MTNTTRVFTARYLITLDTAVLSAHRHTITVTGYGDSIQFTLDGQPATLERAASIRALALDLGTFERVSGPDLTADSSPIIGSQAACALHRDLARMGYTRNGSHYQLAAEALERPVFSLAILTAQDAQTVYGYACAQTGQGSKVWAV